MQEQMGALCCPVCRARFREARLCSRCGADLSPLMLLVAKAFLLRQASRDAFLKGNFTVSQQLAISSEKHVRTAIGHRLSSFTTWAMTCPRHQGSLEPRVLRVRKVLGSVLTFLHTMLNLRVRQIARTPP